MQAPIEITTSNINKVKFQTAFDFTIYYCIEFQNILCYVDLQMIFFFNFKSFTPILFRNQGKVGKDDTIEILVNLMLESS